MTKCNVCMKNLLFIPFVILAVVPVGVFAAIGNLSLDSTFVSISVRIETFRNDYYESDLVLEYQEMGTESWQTGHSLALYQEAFC